MVCLVVVGQNRVLWRGGGLGMGYYDGGGRTEVWLGKWGKVVGVEIV